MNKRGDITVTIFVIGVVALCFFALISFYMSSSSTTDNFGNLKVIESVKNTFEENPQGKGFKQDVTSSAIWLIRDKKVWIEAIYPIN